MAKEWTDDEVNDEIQKALAIFKEDHVVKRLGKLEELLANPRSNDSDNGDGSTEGNPPPPKEKKESVTEPKKSLWWGT